MPRHARVAERSGCLHALGDIRIFVEHQLVITSLATLGTVLLFGLASHGSDVIDVKEKIPKIELKREYLI